MSDVAALLAEYERRLCADFPNLNPERVRALVEAKLRELENPGALPAWCKLPPGPEREAAIARTREIVADADSAPPHERAEILARLEKRQSLPAEGLPRPDPSPVELPPRHPLHPTGRLEEYPPSLTPQGGPKEEGPEAKDARECRDAPNEHPKQASAPPREPSASERGPAAERGVLPLEPLDKRARPRSSGLANETPAPKGERCRREWTPHRAPPDVLALVPAPIPPNYRTVLRELYRLGSVERAPDGRPETVANVTVAGLAKRLKIGARTAKRALAWLREQRLVRPLVRGRCMRRTGTAWPSRYELPSSARHVRLWRSWRRGSAGRWWRTARAFEGKRKARAPAAK